MCTQELCTGMKSPEEVVHAEAEQTLVWFILCKRFCTLFSQPASTANNTFHHWKYHFPLSVSSWSQVQVTLHYSLCKKIGGFFDHWMSGRHCATLLRQFGLHLTSHRQVQQLISREKTKIAGVKVPNSHEVPSVWKSNTRRVTNVWNDRSWCLR